METLVERGSNGKEYALVREGNIYYYLINDEIKDRGFMDENSLRQIYFNWLLEKWMENN